MSMRCLAILLFLLALAVFGDGQIAPNSSLTFAVIPKNVNNDFFSVVRDGCMARAALITAYDVTCLYMGPEEDDAVAQAGIIDAIINGTYGKIDGISVSVSDAAITGDAIDRAMNAGIPVITFDSDANESLRKAYIGTDNFRFGQVLGKLLDQLDPLGGKYGIVAASAPNVVKRVNGVRHRLMNTNSKWVEVDNSWKDCLDSTEKAVELMYEFADEENVNAIIAVGGWPMFDANSWKEFVEVHRNLTLVVGDTLPVQLQLMNRGYVDGLVGQLPFSMGELSIDVLLAIVRGQQVKEQIYGTALLEVLKFPLVLPEVNVNDQYISNLAVLAYVLFILVAIFSIGLMVWTFLRRKTRVIRASQPFFLQMICVGVLILASAMLPLTYDSGAKHSQAALNAACMSTPWLATIGFTTIFSALFAKTWRINKIFHNPNAFRRIKITEKDVLRPFFLILTLNVITLSCWTAIAPLTYQRFDSPGTDDWNRVISTYGVCTSESTEDGRGAGSNLPFLITLAIINIGLLVLANAQAYRARTIQTEYAESKYVAIINASILQALLLGMPMVFLLWDVPRAYFTVLVMVIFCICSVVLLFMFWPKIYHTHLWLEKKKEKERKRAEQRARVIRDGADGAALGGINRMESNPIASQCDGLKIAVRPDARFDSTVRTAHGISVKEKDENGLKLAVRPNARFDSTTRHGISVKEKDEKFTQRRDSVVSSASSVDDGEAGLRISVSSNKPNFRSSFCVSEDKVDCPEPPTVRFEQSSLEEVTVENGSNTGEVGNEVEDELVNDENEIEVQTLDGALEEIKRLKQRLSKYE